MEKIVAQPRDSKVYLIEIKNSIERDNEIIRKTFSQFEDFFKNLLQQFTTIIIKPNILPTERINNGLAVSNPIICEILAKYLKELGFEKIILAEGSTNNSKGEPNSIKAMKNNGFILDEELWTPFDFNKDGVEKWFEIYSPGDPLGPENPFDIELGISKIAVKYPIISIAKFKSHDVLGLTLAIKNLMGCLSKAKRKSTGEIIDEGAVVKAYMHGCGPRNPSMLSKKDNLTRSKTALAININRMAKTIFPIFSVIDAAPAMEGNGPLRGTPNNLNLILCSTDSVALDALSCVLINLELDKCPYIKNFGRLNLGTINLNQIQLNDKKLFNKIRKDITFRFHELFKHSQFTPEEIKLLKMYTEEIRN
ncbi:MAG: DUF362 domain-containing protein [Promethearchaeota archaeon]